MKHIKHINPRKTQKIEKPKSKNYPAYIIYLPKRHFQHFCTCTDHLSFFFQRHLQNKITDVSFPFWKAKWWPLQPLIYIYICPEFNLASILSNIKFITVNFFDCAFQSSCVWFQGTHHIQYRGSFCYNLNHTAFVHSTLIQEKLKRLKIPSLKLSSIYHISSKRKHFQRFCTGTNHL